MRPKKPWMCLCTLLSFKAPSHVVLHSSSPLFSLFLHSEPVQLALSISVRSIRSFLPPLFKGSFSSPEQRIRGCGHLQELINPSSHTQQGQKLIRRCRCSTEPVNINGPKANWNTYSPVTQPQQHSFKYKATHKLITKR